VTSFADQVLKDALVHEQAARGGATLAGGADRAEHDRRIASFRSAVSSTMIALLPPSSSSERPMRCATRSADHAADLGRAGEADQRDALVVDEGLRRLGAAVVEQEEDVREAAGLQRFVADLHRGDRRQRGLRRRLPDADVAADAGQEAVPGPDRDREIEGADDADQAERLVLLVHAVAGTLGVHGQAVQLARQADREVADVDHLLHFAVALGLDLAHLQRDQRAQRVLVLAQRVGAQADRFAALGRGHVAPHLERGLAFSISCS
jgi:hypothetical protein